MRWSAVLVAVPACSFTPGAYPDAAEVTADSDVPVGWSEPMLIAELVTPQSNDDPSLTNDLLEIYFGSIRPEGMGGEDIYVAKRTSVNDPFGPAMPVVELNSPQSETTMKVTGLGTAIYFASDRDNVGHHDIYFSTRPDTDSPWAEPKLVTELSTQDGDWAPFAQSDQLRVVLCSGVNQSQEALFVSKRGATGQPWGPLQKISELDETDKSECDPNEPRSNVLYYSSNYQSATFDIYRASRSSSMSSYGNRTGLSEINLPNVNDNDPWVSPDERTMVFASDRNLVSTQLYITTRR